jgi:hypothetical protein
MAETNRNDIGMVKQCSEALCAVQWDYCVLDVGRLCCRYDKLTTSARRKVIQLRIHQIKQRKRVVCYHHNIAF